MVVVTVRVLFLEKLCFFTVFCEFSSFTDARWVLQIMSGLLWAISQHRTSRQRNPGSGNAPLSIRCSLSLSLALRRIFWKCLSWNACKTSAFEQKPSAMLTFFPPKHYYRTLTKHLKLGKPWTNVWYIYISLSLRNSVCVYVYICTRTHLICMCQVRICAIMRSGVPHCMDIMFLVSLWAADSHSGMVKMDAIGKGGSWKE